MIRSSLIVVTLTLLLACETSAQETDLQAFIKAMSGRWVCETIADNNAPGYFKKGDKIRMANQYTPIADGTGMRQEWLMENSGTVQRQYHGIWFWDADSKRIKTYGPASEGYHVEGESWKEGDAWISKSAVIFPDGTKSRSTAITTFSQDGNTRTVVIKDRVNQNGESLDEKTEVWRRVSKNHEVLEQQVGWLIGDWTAEMETADGQRAKIASEYRWIANNQVIALNLQIGTWEGLSLIFFDPEDQHIKMWGANSEGGNGQAVLREHGKELVWTNASVDGEGKKIIRDFSFIKKDENTMIVKYIDEADGKTKEILQQRK